MDKLLTNRNLTIINFSIVTYFILIGLIYFYELSFVLIGVFVEMLTIPFLIAQLVFLVLGIKHLIHRRSTLLTTISIIALAGCTVITIGSFF